MFDSICVHNPQRVGASFDLGLLAEIMVFYQRPRVLVGSDDLISLLRICSPESLCTALEHGFLEVVYLENQLAVATIDAGQPGERHGLVFVESPIQKLSDLAYETLLLWTDNRRKSRNLTDRLIEHVKPEKWTRTEAADARRDLLDEAYVNACAGAAVPHLTGGYLPPDQLRFTVRAESPIERRGISFDMSISTDLSLEMANVCYRRVSDGAFSNTAVLIGIFGALTGLRVAAALSDEMAVSPAALAIAQVKLADLFAKRHQSTEQIQNFVEWTYDEGRAIREAVNARHRNFDDVLRLAEAARPFKEWLRQHPASSDLRREYLAAVSRASWADKLPAKSLRILLYASLGYALSLNATQIGGAAISAGLSVLDTFLVDRILKGWKPNQFVEGTLRGFVK